MQVGVPTRVLSQVLRMAALARAPGFGGIVTSPREAAEVRRELGEGFAIVTPGIRPAGADANDQQRSATPASAIKAGVSHIVVGRPITHAANPAEAAKSILAEMEQAQATSESLGQRRQPLEYNVDRRRSLCAVWLIFFLLVSVIAGSSAQTNSTTNVKPVSETSPDAARRLVVPAGTRGLLNLKSPINTKSAHVGDGVYCQTLS